MFEAVVDCFYDIAEDLYKAILNDNKDMFYTIVEKMEIIDENIPAESKEYMYEYFKGQYHPWLCDDFEFNSEWVKNNDYKNTDLMKYWNLPSNLVYFNKLPYGMYHILGKMNLKGNFLTFYKKLLNIT